LLPEPHSGSRAREYQIVVVFRNRSRTLETSLRGFKMRVRVTRTPIRPPQASAYAERFVRTLRADCLDWLLILGRRHLERVLRIYTAHNRERPHRALAPHPPEPAISAQQPNTGRIERTF
jgi:transposase InsO family protein